MRLNLISKDCAIFFDENAYSINTDKLMGRNSAGASFLSGYFRNGDPKNFWVYARDQKQAENFANLLSRNSTRREAKYISWNNFSELKVPGNLFYPGPDFNKIAWQRRFVGEGAWSICGITHTTSSAGVMDAIGEYYTGPVKSWDALICTSNSVKEKLIIVAKKNSNPINLTDEEMTIKAEVSVVTDETNLINNLNQIKKSPRELAILHQNELKKKSKDKNLNKNLARR